MFRPVAFLFGLPLLASTGSAGGYGFDVLTPPESYVQHLDEAGLSGRHGTWMRVRGLVDGYRIVASDTRNVDTDRAALRALRDRGVKTVVFLRWRSASWEHGTRPGGGHRLPLDLREAYERAVWTGQTYGDVVDAWEIDNEPDIGFVTDNPETYAAYLKAMYLGLHAGIDASNRISREGRHSNPKPAPTPNWVERKRGWANPTGGGPRAPRPGVSRPRVVMAPLALPPGPYFERLWENSADRFTDGFNFHYYGYSEDFTGVYRQFEDAVSRHVPVPDDREHPVIKPLPVFITEYGYGLLDHDTRDTIPGRVRQWRWFADVADQVRALRPEAPLAFLFNPYYEANLNEFGLTIRNDPASGAVPAFLDAFDPRNFETQSAEPWMRRIGHPIGGAHASPALAYLWDYAQRNPYRPRHWQAKSLPASPVVIDLVGGTDMVQAKSSGGYILNGATVEWSPQPSRTGRATLVLYNFGTQPISGTLLIAEPSPADLPAVEPLTLAPGERRELPLVLSVPAHTDAAQRLDIRFRPHAKGVSSAVFTTRLYPTSTGMRQSRVTGFDFEAPLEQSSRLQSRPLAHGEPPLAPQGRWLATQGVTVEETAAGVWRFHINHLPPEPLRPASVELPLPSGFRFDAGTHLTLDHRRLPDVATAPDGIPTSLLQSRAGKAGDMIDVYFRTENGNLYQTWPRLRVSTRWRHYHERAENFTMSFWGRAELPWRFSENTPVSLVFFLRPSRLPAVFEVRNAAIVKRQQ